MPLFIGLLCGVLFFVVVNARYQKKFRAYSYNAEANSRVDLRVKEDRYDRETVTEERIVTVDSGSSEEESSSTKSSSSDSGRSSTHTSSSGREHGGGSRSF